MTGAPAARPGLSVCERGRMLRKMAKSLISLVLTFLLLEGLVRVTDLDRQIMGNPYKGAPIIGMLQPDPFLHWRGYPGMRLLSTAERFNSRGLRGPEIARKRPGVRRIAVLGDSCTFGIVRAGEKFLDLPKPYAARLQELFDRNAGPGRYEVINYGTIGYTTFHGLRILRKEVLHDDPDFVVIRFGFNDHLASPVRHSFYSTRNSLREMIEDAVCPSRLLSLLFFFRGNPVKDASPWIISDHPIVWVTPEEYAWNLSHMIDLCRDHGAEPILLDALAAPITDEWRKDSVDFVNRMGYETMGQYLTAHEDYQAIAARVAREKAVPFVRTAVLPSQAWSYFSRYDIAHPIAAGHERIARILYKEITALAVRPEAP